jgi:hypothetical protein
MVSPPYETEGDVMSDFLEPGSVVLVLLVVVSAFGGKSPYASRAAALAAMWYQAPACFALAAEVVTKHFEFTGWDRAMLIMAIYLGVAGVPSLLGAREASPAKP